VSRSAPSRGARRAVAAGPALAVALVALGLLFAGCGEAPAVPVDAGDAAQGETGADADADAPRDAAADASEDPGGNDLLGDLGGEDAAPDASDDPSSDALADAGDVGADTAHDTDVHLAADADAAFADADANGPSESVVTNLAAVSNPLNLLSYYVDWRTAAAIPTALDVTCDEELAIRIGDGRRRTRHSVFVMGLWSGANCSFSVVGGLGDGASVDIEVEPMPSWAPELTVGGSDVDAASPGWTIFNLNNEFDRVPLKIVMVDERGRYRWYHSRDATGPGQDADVRVVDEGVLVGGWGAGTRPAIVDWEGGVVWEEAIGGHHHVELTSGGAGVLMLHEGGDCPGGVSAAILSEWDRASRAFAWRWALCEHYEPAVPVADWSHVNTIEPLGAEGPYLLSSRNLSSLLLVDPFAADPDESILWMLGQEGDFTALRPDGSPDPNFYYQHDPERQADGSLLMFDNGVAGVREFSRLLQIEYDSEALTWQAVWEYVPDPAIFAPIWGDADRLANGNVLGVFGQRGIDPADRTEVHEVTPAGELVWSLTLPARWGIYRAERVVAPPMGFVLSEGE
jgi:hypothetical protein